MKGFRDGAPRGPRDPSPAQEAPGGAASQGPHLGPVNPRPTPWPLPAMLFEHIASVFYVVEMKVL